AELDAAEARRTLALLVLPGEDELQLAPADSLSGQPPAIETEPAIDIATRRREVAAREAAVEAARAAATLARRERIPDVTLSGGYKRQSDGLTGAFLGVSLPLPLWDRRGGAIDAASARVIAAEARLVLTRRLVENDVAGALARHRSLLRRADLLRDAGAADATDLLDIAQVAYDEGEMELIGLLDAAEALRESRLIETRLRADLWESYYDLERAIGGFDGSTDDMENDE
ncbi:MAG: TolC family protein, partial [Gemmatimonadota bacterium]